VLAVGGSILIAMIVLALIERTDTGGSGTPPSVSSPPRQMTPKDILAEAQNDLKSGRADQVPDLVKNLLTDQQYGARARRLLRQSVLKLKDEAAAGMQKSMFDAGEEVYVKAVGPEKDVIEFSGPLIGAVWVHGLMEGTAEGNSQQQQIRAQLVTMGFKRAVFINNITSEQWTVKLSDASDH
jgi:ABC-type oligopeptide transport system substrate-binding subunit